MELTKKQEDVVKLAKAGGTDKELAILDAIHGVEERVAEHIDKIEKVVAEVEAQKGEDGHTPTDEELTALIKPLIPPAIPGKDAVPPTKSELLALIRPLIPVVKDGETPTDEHLLSLIEALIPEPIPGKDADETAIQDRIENNLPALGERIRDGLELINNEDDKLKIEAVGHLREELDTLKKDVSKPRSLDGGLTRMKTDSLYISKRGLSKTLTYNGDGTLHKVTDADGTKTMNYTTGVLTSITGTGAYRSKTLTYDGSGVLTAVTVS